MDDKSLLGIYENGELIGCADVIRGFPDPTKATIGLLLIAEPQARQRSARDAVGTPAICCCRIR